MIKSQEIQDFIEKQMIKQYGLHGFKDFWFGGYKKNGVWYWEDGTKISLNQKWARSRKERAVLSSWASKLLNETAWFSKNVGDTVGGYLCERAGEYE